MSLFKTILEFSEKTITADSVEDDLQELCLEIQDVLGQEDGGPASIYFCNREEEIIEANQSQKIDIIREYVDFELSFLNFSM